jgi:hypothetical protein
MKKLPSAALIICLMFILASCRERNEEIDFNPNVLSAKNYVYAEDDFIEIFNVILKGVTDTAVINSGYGYIDNCSIENFPDENLMHFHYGEVNRWCPDNKFRRGQYYANFSSSGFLPGVTAIITFDSLFVDDALVQGEITITNLGLNADNKFQFSYKVQNGLITKTDSANSFVIGYQTDFTVTWTQGSETPFVHDDDIMVLTGTSSGTSSKNQNFTLSVKEPVYDYFDCNWLVKGIYDITVPGAKVQTGTIDYITDDNCFYQVNFYFEDNLFFEYLKH